MNPVIKAVTAAAAAGLIILALNGKFGGSQEEAVTSSFGGGQSGFAYLDGSGDIPKETVPNTTYNINVESPEYPASAFDSAAYAAATTSTPTKKSSKSVPYYSTNRQTQSTLNEVGLSKTTASDINRFATDGSGGYIDRYAQQSISQAEADKRANSYLTPLPTSEAPTKKEEKSTAAPNYFGGSGCGVNQSCM